MGTLFSTQKKDNHEEKLHVEEIDAAGLRESKMERSSSMQENCEEDCEIEGSSSIQTDATVKEKEIDKQPEAQTEIRSPVEAAAVDRIPTLEAENDEEYVEEEKGGETEKETESGTRRSSLEEDAAVKLQKVYRSYRTRRNLADCAVVAEELWFVFLWSSWIVISDFFLQIFI